MKLTQFSYCQQSTPMSSNKNTFIEENHPATRRRSLTTLDSLLRSTRNESFLNYIFDMKNHKKSLRQSEEAIESHFKKISNIITMVDDHIYKRLENHEHQIFSIVKAEIDEMREQTRQAVQSLNDVIRKKNHEDQDQMWSLRNELDYFKSEALKLFNENKIMRQEINKLKLFLKQADIQLENSDKLMQNLRKKYIKQHFVKEKLIFKIKEKIESSKMEEITLDLINSIQKSQRNRNIRSLKTQHADDRPKDSNPVQYRIRLYLNNVCQQDRTNENINHPTEKNHASSSLSEDFSNSQIESIGYSDQKEQKCCIQLSQIKNSIVKVQTFTQTEKYQTTVSSSNKYNSLNKHFSTTTFLQIPRQSKKLSLDFRKNRLHLPSNQKSIIKMESSHNKPPVFNQDKRHMRYINLSLNKSKILEMQHEKKINVDIIFS